MNNFLLIAVIILASDTQAQGNGSRAANATAAPVAATTAASASYGSIIFAKLIEEFDVLKEKDVLLTEKNKALSGKVRALATKVETMNAKIATLTSEDNALKSEVQALDGRVKSLETDVSVYGSEVRILTTGRLEVKIGGEWGTVCDDSWGPTQAKVVCKQLGRTGGEKLSKYGNAGAYISWGHMTDLSENTSAKEYKPILMDEVICTGSERKITDCSYHSKSSAMSDCAHKEDVHMKCNPNRL